MDTKKLQQQARFWNLVRLHTASNSSQCWEWTGAKNPNGYGVFGITNKQTMLAHRYCASLMGDITDKVVMHTCDNPSCVRPDHLSISTQQSNMADMFLKQRNNNKLNIQAVRDIRSKRLDRKSFAKLYNVSEFTIGQVQRKETWAWIT